jgi:uncharacterized protein (TIGR02271 family)
MIGRLLKLLLGVDPSPPEEAAPSIANVDLSSPSQPSSPRSTTVFSSKPSQSIDELVVVGEQGESYRLLQRYTDNGVDTLVLGRADGAQVSLPHSELIQKEQGRWLLSDAVRDARGLVIPVVEEQLEVSRERVETGKVRINKTVESKEVVVDDPLTRETVRIEHVPINQVITGEVPRTREEGDVTVIPILEERVVTRTELVLVEEVRIHRERSEYHDPQRITLRKEVVAVERFGEDGKPLPV